MRSSKNRPSRSAEPHERRPVEGALATEGVHRDISITDDLKRLPKETQEADISPQSAPVDPRDPDGGTTLAAKPHGIETPPTPITPKSPQGPSLLHTQSAPADVSLAQDIVRKRDDLGKGHAHDPLEDRLFLNIGTGADHNPSEGDEVPVVAESPSAIDINVYEKAYEEEVDRIFQRRGRSATLYLTRRVEDSPTIQSMQHIFQGAYEEASAHASDFKAAGKESGKAGLAKIVQKARVARHAANSTGPESSTLDGLVAGLKSLKPSEKSEPNSST